MAPRSQLEIVTSSVIRLVKEEASYHKELQQQTERVKKLEAETGSEDENREFTLKQEVCDCNKEVLFEPCCMCQFDLEC
jgi:tubulin-specific chaperone A